MSSETHQKSIAVVYGKMQGDRIAKMPAWLKTRLDDVVNQIDDLLIERDELSQVRDLLERKVRDQEEAITALREQAVRQASVIAEGFKNAKEPGWLEEPGRYDGDLTAVLTVLPGAKKPYRVTVAMWREPVWKDQEARWVESRKGIFSDFDYEHDFKSLWGAIKYLYKVRAFADAKGIAERAQAAETSNRTWLA